MVWLFNVKLAKMLWRKKSATAQQLYRVPLNAVRSSGFHTPVTFNMMKPSEYIVVTAPSPKQVKELKIPIRSSSPDVTELKPMLVTQF